MSLGTVPHLLILRLGGFAGLCPQLLLVVSWRITVRGGMGEKRDGEAGTPPCAASRRRVPSSISPLLLPPRLPSPPSSSILIVPQLAKSEPPSCEGLSLFFSQPPERQQAVSKSVPCVTSAEEAVRAGEEPRRRRLPRLAACQGRNAIHCRGADEPKVLFCHGERSPPPPPARGLKAAGG